MLTEWDREKLRQALGPETGEKVADLLERGAASTSPPVPPAPEPPAPVAPSSGTIDTSDSDTSDDE